MVSDDHTAFLDWFPQLASIGTPPDHLLAARRCLTQSLRPFPAQIGGSAWLLGGAIRLRRAMTATWAAGVISRRCAPVTRRSRPGDRGAAGAGFGSVSVAARTVR